MIIKSKIKIKGKYISYIYTHENNEKLVLMLHGFGSNMHEKENYDILSKKLLDNNIDSLRFDYLGHGLSEGNTEDLTIEIAMNEALTLLKKYPHKKLYIVGTSYGGGLAALLTEKIKVEKLVLWSPLIDAKNNVINPQNHFCKDFLGDEALKQIKEKGYATFGNTNIKFNMNTFNDAKKYDVKKVLLNYKGKVKIFHGTLDLVVPYKQSLELENKNINVELIENAVHCFYDENSKEVINKTVDFLI